MPQEPLPPEAIFSFAISLERAFRGVYGSLSQDLPEPDVKETLRNLADDELGHERLLLHEHAALGGSTLQPTEEKGLFSMFQKGREKARWVASPAEIIRIAIAVELRGERFYSSWAEKAPNDDARKLLTFLASEEPRHAAILTERYRAITGADPIILPEDSNLIPWPVV